VPNPSKGVPNAAGASVTQLIVSAMRAVGSLGSGEAADASEIQDAGMILNQMLDAWSAERLSIFVVTPLLVDSNGLTLSLVANQQKYLLGNQVGTEDFFLPRPPRLERVSIFYSASQSTPVEIPMDMYDDVQWQGIANKSTPSILPQVCYREETFPDIALYFWPIPTQANPVALYAWQALTEFADLTLPMTFPPGYMEAIRYNLAVRLFAEFPGDASKFPAVQELARQSKARISSINAPIKVATCDDGLLGTSYPRGNIITGGSSRAHNF
jgi:hypothetical protein